MNNKIALDFTVVDKRNIMVHVKEGEDYIGYSLMLFDKKVKSIMVY